ncbi:mechanosensitive ion channel [Candidatus Woesearchaeota archaeon]|nr:mechanosensitive ion channel [Candidatus Woesearchaeota archaeon]
MIDEAVQITKNYAYTIITAVVILLIGFALGILAKKLAARLLREVELNRIMHKVNVMYDVERWISWIISSVIYLITFVWFLKQLGITSTVLYIVVGAIFMLLVLTIIVGLKDVIPNFVGWIFLQRQDKVKEGSRIDVKEIAGTVEKIGFLETEIKTDNEDILYVPNALFLKNKFWVKK